MKLGQLVRLSGATGQAYSTPNAHGPEGIPAQTQYPIEVARAAQGCGAPWSCASCPVTVQPTGLHQQAKCYK
eukprot:10729887-Lingulodinium_polyedra.AAC.1